jgi:hypothetical protein
MTHRSTGGGTRKLRLLGIALVPAVAVIAALLGGATATSQAAGAGESGSLSAPLTAEFTEAAAFDVSSPLRVLAKTRAAAATSAAMPPERPLITFKDRGHSGDGAVQGELPSPTIPGPIANFEGLSNQDNFDVFGFRVNPPDPVGDVGPNHYVEMINLVFGVFDKAGNKLLGPVDTGTLWADFPIEDCTDPSGDPIVVYDQFVDRWILTQFTTRGLDDPSLPFYNCVAISQTGDPTGAYYRYAFITQADPDGGFFFPDYPKYGVWRDTYVMTTRDFGTVDGYGISVYGLEKNKMVDGDPNARAVQFFLDSEEVPLNLIGDGLLPADIDGKQQPRNDAKIPIVGTQDDG